MTAAPLTICDIDKKYNDRTVLSQIQFSLVEGEMFGLIGLNGAGKTTLIKIILDLASANGGHAEIFGLKATNIDARKQLSYLPEKFQPSRYLKGMEYLDLAVSYYGMKLDREKARSMAAALDLNPDVLDARVGSYSKGMGQKLGLLGGLLLDVPLLILDEPMSGLDPSARIRLKNLLMDAKAKGRTIFFSSHILSDIDEICDRIGVIHNGKLCYVGKPDAFKARYGEQSLEKAFLKSIDGSVIPANP